MMADICNCTDSRSCGCHVPSQRMSNVQGNRTFRTLIAISTDRMPGSIEAGCEADFEPWLGPTDPNSRVNPEFEEVSIGVTNVDARTRFPAATFPRSRT
jgi:hypothetical protein